MLIAKNLLTREASYKVFGTHTLSREPHEATLTVLTSELTAAGIVFAESVEFRKWPPKLMSRPASGTTANERPPAFSPATAG